jgi:hypothetical protein
MVSIFPDMSSFSVAISQEEQSMLKDVSVTAQDANDSADGWASRRERIL